MQSARPATLWACARQQGFSTRAVRPTLPPPPPCPHHPPPPDPVDFFCQVSLQLTVLGGGDRHVTCLRYES